MQRDLSSVEPMLREAKAELFNLRFQAANYSRILGDAADSRAMMESAIALDDRHGLTDDSLDNREAAGLPAAPVEPPGRTANA